MALVKDKFSQEIFHKFLAGCIYHRPGPCGLTTTNHSITSINDTISKHPHTGVMVLILTI